MRSLRLRVKRIVPVVAALALAAGIATPASAATPTFTTLSKSTSNAAPAATSVDTFAATGVLGTSIGCISVVYSTASDGTGAMPAGFAATNVGSSTTVLGSTTAADITSGVKFTRAATTPADGNVVVAVTNPTTPGSTTYFATVSTYTDTACTPANVVQSHVVAYVYTANTEVSVTIDPTLTFTVGTTNVACGAQAAASGTNLYPAQSDPTAVTLGTITGTIAGNGANTLTVGTNAGGSVVVNIRGDYSGLSATNYNMKSGSYELPDSTTPGAGVASFGYTATGDGAFKRLSNSNVAAATFPAAVSTSRCVGFTAGAAPTTPAGKYTAKVYYTAVPTY